MSWDLGFGTYKHMLLIQIIIIIFCLFAITRVGIRYKKNETTAKETIVWGLLWIIVAVVVALPQTTTLIANYLGVGRGVDVIVYLSIVVIFYILFRIFIRLEKIERDITKLVRNVSLENIKKDK